MPFNPPTGIHTLHAVVTDNEGATNVSGSVVVEIVAPPFIITSPSNQTVYAGSTATFAVTAGGGAPLSYQWRMGGTPILNATNGLLVLSNVQPVNIGSYIVRVSNSFGFMDSGPASLSLKPLPTLGVTYGGLRVALTWPEENGDFHAETTTNLSPPVMWQPVPGNAALQGGKWTVVLPIDQFPQSYFQLVTP